MTSPSDGRGTTGASPLGRPDASRHYGGTGEVVLDGAPAPVSLLVGLTAILDATCGGADTGRAMSQENIELVRRATDAYNRGDLDGFLQDWAPDAVLDWSNSRGVDARVLRGHDEIRGFAERFLAAWDEVRIDLLNDPEEVKNGLLVAENVTYLRGRDGVEVEARSAWLVTIRNGEQTSLTLYQTKQEALEAVGLRE